ncbi:acyltransferase [Aurantiacibacter sp. MUD61]|uniref:acyltransferase n=1 Tax=Aurantiacibacter sp. MUD61 TaxID=3009083 RepID=UPI0022F105A8|nr:acyltransferase [Aurantiacibacter sp. MUD61]
MIPAIWKFKGALMRLSCPLFFKRIGAGAQFTGRIRLPLPFRNVTIGRNAMIGHDVFFQTGKTSRITIGDDVSLNTGTHLVAGDAITIGNNVAVGEYVSIRDQDHRFIPAEGVRGQGFAVSPIVIEDNVWIGRGVHIGPGAHIRSGSIVAANSVVKGDYPANSLIAGAPATQRRLIQPDGTLTRP